MHVGRGSSGRMMVVVYECGWDSNGMDRWWWVYGRSYSSSCSGVVVYLIGDVVEIWWCVYVLWLALMVAMNVVVVLMALG